MNSVVTSGFQLGIDTLACVAGLRRWRQRSARIVDLNKDYPGGAQWRRALELRETIGPVILICLGTMLLVTSVATGLSAL